MGVLYSQMHPVTFVIASIAAGINLLNKKLYYNGGIIFDQQTDQFLKSLQRYKNSRLWESRQYLLGYKMPFKEK